MKNSTKTKRPHTDWQITVEHYPAAGRCELVHGPDKNVIAEVFGDDSDEDCWPMTANAARLAACWNACIGIRNPAAVPALFAAVWQWNAADDPISTRTGEEAISAALLMAEKEPA